MPELNIIQPDLLNQRETVSQKENNLKASKAKLQQHTTHETQTLKGLSGQALVDKQTGIAQQKATLSEQVKNDKQILKAERIKLHEMQQAAFSSLDPTKEAGKLNDKLPILFFPLRLETRFKQSAAGNQLWLRVYPDDCNVTKPEGNISTTELANTKTFWVEFWKALGDEGLEKGAWRALVNSHGIGRATWLTSHAMPAEKRVIVPGHIKHILMVHPPITVTHDERNALDDYWIQRWLAKADLQAIDDAETTLRDTLSINEEEAASLKAIYTPVNINDTVPEGLSADKVKVVVLEVNLEASVVEVNNSWTEAPRMKAMPDKFVAILYTGMTKRTVIFTKPVRDSLAVGIDPLLDETDQIKKDANNDLEFNEDLSWMIDFEKAVDVGMGMKIDLSTKEASAGFDKIFVIGLRFSTDENASAGVLEKLIEEHFHSEQGFELIKQGTPTNNTEESPSGHSSDGDADASYARLFRDSEAFTETDVHWLQSDGQRLAESLNLKSGLFKNKVNAKGHDQMEAYAMNTALFPATMGYFMEEMMDSLFSERSIEQTRFFASRFVSARGPIPAIKIGRQPYGILPTTVYSKIGFYEHLSTAYEELGNAKDPYLKQLNTTLKQLDKVWTTLSDSVDYIGKTGDPHQVLLSVLGLHSNSVEFHQRYAQSIEQLYNQLKLKLGPIIAALVAAAIANRAKTVLTDIGLDPLRFKLPILEKFFLSAPNPLTGGLVDDIDASESTFIRAYTSDNKNYLEWLETAGGEVLRTQNFGSGKSAPNALLYMLLRHSLLLAQSKAATNLYVDNALITDKNVFHDKAFMHIQKTDEGRSKFEHLYKPVKSITGSDTKLLIDYIYEVLPFLTAADQLKDVKSALTLLKDVPTARLERLLIEHLDICNYRLDAWRTGLAHYKLVEQQQLRKLESPMAPVTTTGIYLGAYGWLEHVKPKTTVPTAKQLPDDLTEIFNPGNKNIIVTDKDNLGFIHAPSVDQASTAAILRNAYDSHKGSGTNNPFAINLNSERVRLANQFLEGVRNGQTLNALLGYQFERGLHENTLGVEADVFIYPLRKAFPLASSNLNTTTPGAGDIADAQASNGLASADKAIETIEANNVIDGLKLIEHVQKTGNKIYPFGLPASHNLPVAGSAQKSAIETEVNRIMEIHDAISDLVMAEQVYQTVKGNVERSAGVSNAFSKGTYPPDIDVVKTERTGITLTHRIGVHFDPDASTTVSPNTVSGMTPRAMLEPSVNAWISSILPDPKNVLCRVTYSTPLAQNQKALISQADLGLQSVDLLFSMHFDSDQSMTELDDRILHYVRHTISKHPDTQLQIAYTDTIDVNDTSKISFFELAALVKRLRKIVGTTRYLKPDTFNLPTGETTEAGSFDTTLLKSRITLLASELNQLKTNLTTIQSGIISLKSLKKALKAGLAPHAAAGISAETLAAQLETDAQSFLTNPTANNKTDILTAFENAIAAIGNAATINTLKADYGTKLESYKSDFGNLDDLFKTVSDTFLSIAKYDSQQTGTGFIHQAIGTVYDSTYTLLDKVITRWEKKKDDYENLMLTFDPAGDEDEQFTILQKAERLIAPRSTFPVPSTLTIYKGQLDLQKNNFDTTLLELKALKANTRQTVIGFIQDAQLAIAKMPLYDIIPFDSDKNIKDLYTQKISLLQLKESVDTAISNEITYLVAKDATAQAALAKAQAATDHGKQVELYLTVVKTILGDDAVMIPQLLLPDTKAAEIENTYKATDTLLTFIKGKEVALPVEDWLGGVARVREKAHDWESAVFLTAAFQSSVELSLRPLQFPYTVNDRWLALQFKETNEDFKPVGDKLLYTAHFAVPYDKTKPVCGMVVDEWTEVLPAEEETTGIVFHYDQPNSEPPQTMLLMVPPVFQGEWSWENMVLSLEETLEAAKKRAVEPGQIEMTAYAQFLPSTVSAVTTHLLSVAMNLSQNNVAMPKTN
jgi:hypothetical protein